MVRSYKKISESNRLLYTQEDMAKALCDINNGITVSEASAQYNIPVSSLYRSKHGLVAQQHGQPACPSTPLLQVEERTLAQSMASSEHFSVDFDLEELRKFVKKHLDQNHRTIDQFDDNMPGIEWARGFMKRHSKLLTQLHYPNIISDEVMRMPASIEATDGNEDSVQITEESVKITEESVQITEETPSKDHAPQFEKQHNEQSLVDTTNDSNSYDEELPICGTNPPSPPPRNIKEKSLENETYPNCFLKVECMAADDININEGASSSTNAAPETLDQLLPDLSCLKAQNAAEEKRVRKVPQKLTDCIMFAPSKEELLQGKRHRGNASHMPLETVRTDAIAHWPEWRTTRQRCKMPLCKGLTYVHCVKCEVALCFNKYKNCYTHFHST